MKEKIQEVEKEITEMRVTIQKLEEKIAELESGKSSSGIYLDGTQDYVKEYIEKNSGRKG